MVFKRKIDRIATAAQNKSWAAFSLLVLVTLIPSICVWWLIYEASESKRLAMKQLYNDARSSYLESGRSLVLEEVADVRRMLDKALKESSVAEWESRVLRETQADGFFAASVASLLSEDAEIQAWATQKLDTIKLAIREERSLDASQQVSESLSDERIFQARLSDGRWVTPILMHLAVDLSENEEAEGNAWQNMRGFLLSNLGDQLPLPQRRFYLKKVVDRFGDTEVESRYEQAKTALGWLDLRASPIELSELPAFERTGVFVHIRSSEGTGVVIFKKEAFQARIEAMLASLPPRAGGRLSVRAIGSEPLEDEPNERLRLDSGLEDWELVFLEDAELSSASEAERQVLFLVFIGALVVALSLGLSFALYRMMRRQADLAQLKNDLVATVSHELKTPVASIRLLIDILQNGKSWDSDRVREYLELISKENKRLGRLIENFLSFSRMERNKSNFVLQETSAREIAREAESIFRESVASASCSVRVNIVDGLKPIMADAEALQTAIGNLLENACKYGGEDPEIGLSVSNSGSGVVFEVSDRGEGISEDEQGKIFERFYQSKRRLSEHAGGVGLGLSIVSFIVEKHGGRVSLESALGKGSVFKIEIPYV